MNDEIEIPGTIKRGNKGGIYITIAGRGLSLHPVSLMMFGKDVNDMRRKMSDADKKKYLKMVLKKTSFDGLLLDTENFCNEMLDKILMDGICETGYHILSQTCIEKYLKEFNLSRMLKERIKDNINDAFYYAPEFVTISGEGFSESKRFLNGMIRECKNIDDLMGLFSGKKFTHAIIRMYVRKQINDVMNGRIPEAQ